MTRDKAFVAAVQSGLADLCPSAEHKMMGEWTSERDVYDVVAMAAAIPEEAIPHDVASAARDFVGYAMGKTSGVPPEWYGIYLEEVGEEK